MRTMKNAELAAVFDTMADIMEVKGENPFRISSYRKVARIVRDLAEDIEQVAAEGRLGDLPGVGKSSAEKIQEYLQTGKMAAYEALVRDFPLGALEMLKIPTLGPKTLARLLNEKGIDSVEKLEAAIREGRLEGMAGIGRKTLENIQRGIEMLKKSRGRTRLGAALPIAREIVAKMRERCRLIEAEPAGSLRRRRETVGDVDILVTVEGASGGPAEQISAGTEVVREFTSLDIVSEVLAAGATKGSVRTREGLQVDLRVVSPQSFGAALQYFTGSKAHNVRIRGIALDKGLKVNEYGVFRGDESIAGATEEDVYAALGLPWIPPELREDRGEVEAALEGRLPALITMNDVQGDFHAHTNYSDGSATVLQMARAAQELGYRFLGLTDHSKSLGVAGGLDEEKLARRNEEIERARQELGGFLLLKGAEVDILEDGSLDYDDDTLAGLDVVIAAVHAHLTMDEPRMTERICKAAANPHVHIIAHPTGRLIGEREPYPVNMAAVIEACAEHGTALELNAYPERLDITDTVCRQAKEAGVKVAIGTDSHSPSQLRLMEFGVAWGRRGWLEPQDVLNCWPTERLLEFLHRKKT